MKSADAQLTSCTVRFSQFRHGLHASVPDGAGMVAFLASRLQMILLVKYGTGEFRCPVDNPIRAHRNWLHELALWLRICS